MNYDTTCQHNDYGDVLQSNIILIYAVLCCSVLRSHCSTVVLTNRFQL